MTLAIPTTWHAGPHALPSDLVNYLSQDTWILIASFGVDELIQALSNDKIYISWIKQTDLHIIADHTYIEMKAFGVRHNPFGGPAHIDYYRAGGGIQGWYRNGMLHRTDGPAYVETHADGHRIRIWYENGKRHRIDKPAHVEVREDGGDVKLWYENDKLHRIDGPAHVEDRATGRHIELWYIDGKLHRIGGPAYIESTPHNCIERWYENGILVPAPH